MKVFIAAIGSGGDVNPLLAIGVQLSCRGHQVTVLAGEWHASAVSAAGLAFHPVLGAEQFGRVGDMARSLGSAGGAWAAFYRHAVMPAIAEVYDFAVRHMDPGNTLMIGAIQAIGLRLVAERYGVPLVTVMVQPRAAAWDGGDEAANEQFDAMFRPLLNRHRRRAGLPPLDVPFHRWMNRATHAVGLFPPWFVSPELDSLDQGEMVGFVRFDGQGAGASHAGLDAFLARHDAPWVFTYGTGNDQAGEFFQAAIEAAAKTGIAAVLLGCRDDVSGSLPPMVLPLDYAPLGSLLPYCAGIVHHGGIGTCAQAMRAGIPQVIVPMAFDQFLNAARLEQLGVGVTLRSSELSAGTLASVLADISSDRTTAERCMQRSREVAREDDALQRCCEIIERMAGPRRLGCAPTSVP